MEQQEEERYVNAFGRQAVSVAAAVSLQQCVALQLAEVVAELVEFVALRGEPEGGEMCIRDSNAAATADAAVRRECSGGRDETPANAGRS